MPRFDGLYYEEHGSGEPILCIHGAGSSTLLWADAIAKLAELGRVIAYDRRGCSRSERPEPYERTSTREHADDAVALLDELQAAPAVVIGRSYGGTVGLDMALRHPDKVRAVVSLEGDAPRELAPRTAAWLDGIAARIEEAEVPGELLIDEIYEPGAWTAIPDELRRVLTENGPALRAEVRGAWWLDGDPAGIRQPVLLVAANDSRPELREPSEALAAALPNARLARVDGGHLIDPAAPVVLDFVAEVLG
ncbi:MAG TPA: alpha/beta hydrolase [Solirubrobacteraceae bacterium]|nr:alpha/beta hydrolase [Solirubrobacteraceae bacterium]